MQHMQWPQTSSPGGGEGRSKANLSLGLVASDMAGQGQLRVGVSFPRPQQAWPKPCSSILFIAALDSGAG